jgi:hypothetical protein
VRSLITSLYSAVCSAVSKAESDDAMFPCETKRRGEQITNNKDGGPRRNLNVGETEKVLEILRRLMPRIDHG